MFKKLVYTTLVFVVLVLPQTGQAQDMSAVVARMDEIIKEMEALRAEFSTLSATVSSNGTATTPAVLGSTAQKTITMDVSYGETNDDIKRIQTLLATDPEIYDHPYVTGFFGQKTEEAIRNFQTRFGLDPVGVVGPATTALLEVFFAAYPDENYPAGVLAKKPTVLGASTSNTQTTTNTSPATINTTGVATAREVNVQLDDGEALIEIIYSNGNRKGLVAPTDDEDEVVDYIVANTPLARASIESVIDFDGKSSSRDDDDDEKAEADDALDEAEDALDDADEEIEEADDDGDDVDWAEDTLEEADDLFKDAEDAFEDEDYGDAIDLANKAKKMARKAEDRIGEEEGSVKGDSDDIDEINVDVKGKDDAEVTVEYDDGEEYEFDVEEDKKSNIIEEVADELDMDEDDVEDLIEFDYGDIDRIEVRIDEDEGDSLVRVFYESDVEVRIRLNETDEDDIIEEVADELDEDEEDIEDLFDFL